MGEDVGRGYRLKNTEYSEFRRISNSVSRPGLREWEIYGLFLP